VSEYDQYLDDEPALTEREGGLVGDPDAKADVRPSRSASAADPKPVSAPKRRFRSKGPAPIDEPRRGSCSAYAPRGTRCKICGGVH
jgi:hypothetical protein